MSIAIILASGTSSRFHSEVPKQFLKLAGKTVLEHTLDAFEKHPDIEQIVVVCREEQRLLVEELVGRSEVRKVQRIVRGGDSRRESSASGIAAVEGDGHKVLVHDAARPLIDGAIISRCLDALDDAVAVDTGIAAGDTVIEVDGEAQIANIPNRASLRLGQTPQAFRSGVLREAHRRAGADDMPPLVTDDCGLVLHYELAPVKVVAGDVNNIKITYPSDIYLADRLFQMRARRLADGLDHSQLAGKVLVVFGASRGIGEHMVSIAQAHGATVVGVSRASGVDITDADAVRSTLEAARAAHGRVDMVANTAGILRTGYLVGQSDAVVAEQIAINLTGSVVVAREAFDCMKDTGGSISLFTSSSYTRGRARSSVYSATKAAVVNLMQGLSEEFNPHGVRINAVSPERTQTPMRTENFGIEPSEELLDATKVAEAALATMLSAATGEVIDVRR